MSPIRRTAMKLRRLRNERDMSQQELAEKAGISREYLNRLEAARQDPTLGTLEKLAKALKVKVTALLE
ncbi:MAG: helix-turn-helix transcriptional regulator [Candidatus Rokubacteria bacterium]|nr:helix-turn-helix transcriptional regulator [Candidatus Rokubacteria bacterium]